MRPALTLPKDLAVSVLTAYLPDYRAREILKNPRPIEINFGKDVLVVLPAGPGKVTIQ